MSKKIQVVISDSMFDAVDTMCTEYHFNTTSDFIRECIRYYLHRSPNTAAMEEEIRKLLYGLPLDEQIIAIKNKMKELEEFKRDRVLKE
jgi:Arc/MetJ-type ribon-helix-helix transcriptional regulator